MFIVLVVLFLATALAFGTVATVAAVLSWRAYGLLTLLCGGYVAWRYLDAPTIASPGSPSPQFAMGFVVAGFLCAAAFAPALAWLIRVLVRRKPEASPPPQALD